jgi:glycosyltransferase involved in cell wall biosynthesis
MRKKVLIIGDGNSPHTAKWIESLHKEESVEIFLFSLSTVESKKYNDSKKLIIQDSAWSQTSKLTRIIDYFKAILILRKFYKKIRPDIVHAHYATSSGLLACLINPKKLFVSVWGSEVYIFPKKSFLHKLLFQGILKRADSIFSTSSDMARETKIYTQKRVDVIPFGIDLTRFRKVLEKDKNLIRIGIVKSLKKIYGIDILIRSFALLVTKYPEKHLQLLIIGGGPEEHGLRTLCKKLNVFELTSFTGKVDQSEIAKYHNKLDIAVYPSHSESFGVSVLESSACEVPVIVSAVGGLPEVVIDESTGFIVKENTPESIVALLSLLVEKENKRVEFGVNGRQFVSEKYSWSRSIESMLIHYRAN